MKKFILGLFLSLGILSFSNCIPAGQIQKEIIDVVWYKKGVPRQYHYGYVPRTLTRITGYGTPNIDSTTYIIYVPVRELSRFRITEFERYGYFTLSFKQCMY